MARQFPAVLVTGARQTGKTSLLRRLFPRASCLSLDLPAHADAASSAPEALIEPYSGNRTKRLIKAPKLVVLDTGLAAFLAGFRSARELAASALVGAFWESHVAGQIVRQAANRGDTTPILYWRTASGPEVDLVIERAGGTLAAIECKWKERPAPADSAGLRALESAEGKRVKEKMIVCRTKTTYKLADGTWVLGVAGALKRLAAG